MSTTKRLSKDHIDKFFDYDVELDSRTIYMGSVEVSDGEDSGVDAIMAERVLKALHLLEFNPSLGDRPISIIMNNPGGDWYHGMAIYDAIRSCKNTITIKVYGYAMSMGSIILQAADERQISENSKFMIHYGTSGYGGHAKIVDKWAKECQRIDYDMENIYLDVMLAKDHDMTSSGDSDYYERTLSAVLNKQNEGSIPPKPVVKVKLPKDPDKRREALRAYLQDMLNFDTILTAEETIALGFADSLI